VAFFCIDLILSRHTWVIEVGEFDPYHQWLAIPKDIRPPNHYHLLGLQMFEANVAVIENAADARMRHISSYSIGPYSAFSQRLMTEISAARVCLCHERKKKEYDENLCITPNTIDLAALRTDADLPNPEEPRPDPWTGSPQAAAAFPELKPMPQVEEFSSSDSVEILVAVKADESRYTKKRNSPFLLVGLIICFLVALAAVIGLLRS